MITNLEDLIPRDGAWLILLVFASLVFGPAAVLSKGAADKLWLLGRIRRWVRDRKVREIEETARLADVTLAGHEADRARWIAEAKALRAEAKADREQSQKRIAAMDRKLDRYWDYIVYVAGFGRTLAMLAAQHGWDPAPPLLLTFDEWSKRQNDKPRPPDTVD